MPYRSIKLFCLAGLALSFSTLRPAFADSITATINGVENVTNNNYTTIHLKLNGADQGNVIAGAEMWTRTSGAMLPEGNHFDTYCIEILQDVYLGSSYTFSLGNVADAPHPGASVQTVGSGTGMGSVKADLISELWAEHYSPALNADDSAAFQLAVWKIVYEPATLNGPEPLDLSLSNGALLALGATDSSIITTAQTWLNGLTGLDSAPHASLVSLSSPTAQDQITLACPLPATACTALALLGACAVVTAAKRSSPRALRAS